MFNDSMGEVHNFSYDGFPNRDSDVYGNYISHCWDDGIEIEGANMNVRVWENYITMTFTPSARPARRSGRRTTSATSTPSAAGAARPTRPPSAATG